MTCSFSSLHILHILTSVFLSAYALLDAECYKKGYADLISSKLNDFLVSVITSRLERNKDGDRWIILLIKAVQCCILNNGKL